MVEPFLFDFVISENIRKLAITKQQREIYFFHNAYL